MIIYRKDNNSIYASYLEIEEGLTDLMKVLPEHWRQSASVKNDDLLSAGFRVADLDEYILGYAIYQKVNLPPAPAPAPAHDPVNNPKHYDLFADGTQSIDILQAALTPDEFMGFLKGNCLKYKLRAGDKDDLQQDIDKSNWYKNKIAEVCK